MIYGISRKNPLLFCTFFKIVFNIFPRSAGAIGVAPLPVTKIPEKYKNNQKVLGFSNETPKNDLKHYNGMTYGFFEKTLFVHFF